MARMHTLFALLIAGLFMAWAPAASAAKVATVDFQKAINEVKEGVQAQGRLEGMFAEKQKAIASMETQLATKQEEYQKQALILSAEARQQKEQELYQLQMQYQQVYMQSEQEMQAEYAKTMEGLIAKMRTICTAIGKEKTLDVILEVNEGGVVYVGAAEDVTPELIRRYNAKYPG